MLWIILPWREPISVKEVVWKHWKCYFISQFMIKTFIPDIFLPLLAIHSFSSISNFQVENNPYDPSLMVFMDYRDCVKEKKQFPEEVYPTFLYVMPMTATKVFFEVCCRSNLNPPSFPFVWAVVFIFESSAAGNMLGIHRRHAFWSSQGETHVAIGYHGYSNNKSLWGGTIL